MIRARKIALALGLALVATGCDDDFLTTAPPDAISDEIFWQQEKDAVFALTSVYSLNNAFTTVIWLESAADNAWAQKSFEDWFPIARGAVNSASAATAGIWNNAYEAIRRANEILANIDRIPEMDEELRTRLKGETYFHRAYHYNILVNAFGDVPLILEPITLAESRELTRTPRAQVIQQVMSDLDQAISALPSTYPATERGRVTRGAALALKARAALYAAGWEQNHFGDASAADNFYTQAAEAAKAVIDEGFYSLEPDYHNLTRYAGNNSNEIIFEDIRLPPERGHGAFSTLGPNSLQGGNSVVPLRALVDAYQMANGLPISDPASGYDPDNPYLDRDPRLYSTLLYPPSPGGAPGAIFEGDGYSAEYNSLPDSPTADRVAKDFNTTATGYNFIKYVNLEDRDDRGNSGVHLILIRYAEVLLTYAEAKIELNQIDQSVYDAINVVRTRGGMPEVSGLSQAALRDIVRYERRIEFAMEGLRLWDIRRWKTAEDVLNGQTFGIDYIEGGEKQAIPADDRIFDPAKNYLWPVPLTEIERNANLTQNAGY